MPLGEEFRRRFGNPYGVVHRADLHDALRRGCQSAGLVDLRVNSRVERYEQDARRVKVDANLETSARLESLQRATLRAWPDPHCDANIRVEHFAMRNMHVLPMLGAKVARETGLVRARSGHPGCWQTATLFAIYGA